MKPWVDHLGDATALVVDGNLLSRSVVVAQLRDLGIRAVSQAPRISDARRQLEFKTFDLVVCENHFPNDSSTGQDLLDDLRRCGLLPFSTIFIMLTAEASYSKVAEAAESALDSYLLRPYTTTKLEERIFQARRRKMSLREIFTAIEEQDFALGAQLCMERFDNRGEYWLYAARVGAELLLRTQQYNDAQRLYEAVIQAQTVPWARLGVARAQIESGQIKQSATTLEELINTDPGYADAYDVMGRAQIELGNFESAIQSYKMAADMTPASISRLQRYGMLAHYCGQTEIAEEMLSRSVRLGLDSKMFDAQTLVLLAFMRLHNKDRKGLLRCHDDLRNMIERNPDSNRLRRLERVVDAMVQLMNHQTAKLLELCRGLMNECMNDDFDFEAACNVLTIVSLLAQQAIQIDEVDSFVKKLGMRFCTSKALTELVMRAAEAYPPYAEGIANCQDTLLRLQEQALKLGLNGDGLGATLHLLKLGEETLNSKVIESAWGVFKRYEKSIDNADTLTTHIQGLRTRYQTQNNRTAIGDKSLRQSGGVSLRGMDPKPEAAAPGGNPANPSLNWV